jgi:hypothetical protein
MSSTLRPQSFANHRAIPPPLYMLAGFALLVEAVHRARLAVEAPDFWSVCAVLTGVAFLIVFVASRRRAQIVQDRVIRLEMQLRLERLLGVGRKLDIERLTLPQRIALRFAGEAELPALFERVVKGELVRPDDIKRAVKDWQSDWLRV